MKKKLLSILQLAIGIGLIAFIFTKMRRGGEIARLFDALRESASQWPLLCAGVMLFLGCLLLCSFRWQRLMRANGVDLSYWKAFELYMVGHFFNSFMLGSTGGDLVKAYYVSKVTAHRKTEVVSTVFIDRIIGMIALIGFMVTMTVARLDFFMQSAQTRLIVVGNAIILGVIVFGITIMFRRNMIDNSSLLQWLENRFGIGAVIGKIYEAFRVCFLHRGLMFWSLIVSLANHLCFFVAACCFGRALGVHLALFDFVTVMPVIATVAAIPITPGGLGTREGASIFVFGLLGVPASKALLISLMVFASVTIWALIGGIVYIVYAQRAGRVSAADAEVEGKS